MGLTKKQLACARTIHELTAAGQPPTLEELGIELGTNRSGAHALVRGLQRRGWLRWPMLGGKAEPRAMGLLHTPPPIDQSPVAVTKAGRAYLKEHAPCHHAGI